jgi:WD40 repeat protein/energy-coupling factor transporter ATP-binding protein EcfA2
VLTGALLQALDPERQLDGVATNYTLTDFINQLSGVPQRPICRNSGGQILLTGSPAAPQGVRQQEGVCPYRGLRYFDFNQEDPQYFCGRTELTDRLVGGYRQGNFLAVLGASGSGKSSLLRSGLLHQLKLGQKLSESKGWKIYPPFTPGNHPLQSLAQVFVEPGLSAVDRAAQFKKAQDLIAAGAEGLKCLIAAADAPRTVLAIDQFEEVFTLCDEAERQQFFECLLGALDGEADSGKSGFFLVLAMRADFLGKCADYAGLAARIERHKLLVTPMQEEELREAIVKPAERVCLEIERELVDEIVADAQSPGNLPLVQYALTLLWEQRALNRLTLSEYKRSGGVRGALKKRADEVYELLSPEEQLVAKRIFLELTQLGEGTEDTRRQVFKEDLVGRLLAGKGRARASAGVVERAIEKLAEARLVVVGEVRARGDSAGEVPVVDVAHEALIRHWPLLRQWVDENRSALRQKRVIEAAAQEWREKGKRGDYLLGGLKLAEAEGFLQNHAAALSLSEPDREFVRKSISRRRNNRMLTVGIFATVLIVVTGLWLKAERDATIATLREKAARSEKMRSVQPVEALVLAIQATGESQAKLQQVLQPVQSSLLAGVQTPVEQNRFQGHQNYVDSVAFSPDGEYIVSSSLNIVRLWNRKGELIGSPFVGHQDVVTSVAFSPDGQTIVSGSRDGIVRLWNRNGEPIGSPFVGHQSAVTSVAFSPDGEYIVSGSDDKTVRLWNRKGEAIGSPFVGHQNQVDSVAFSPDGQSIVSGSVDKTVRLWNRQGVAIGSPFVGHQGYVISVAFSPDGEYIVSGSLDKTVRLWNRKGEAIGSPFVGHQSAVTSVAFSPDGEYIVSGSVDKTVRLWNRKGEAIGSPFIGHQSWVISVAFSPDGESIVSGSRDNMVRLWNRKGEAIGSPFLGHQSAVTSVAFSPDGESIVSGSRDNMVRLWNRKGELIGSPFIGHQSAVTSVAFSPDGESIVSGSWDKTVRLWNRKGELIGSPFIGHQGWVKSVAFSPDGEYIVSGSLDKTVRLWNRKGEAIGAPFIGHQSWVISVAFSPDGESIVSGSSENTVRLWNRKGEAIGSPFVGHQDSVTSVAFSPDGQYIVSGSGDKTVRLWNRKGEAIGSPFVGHEDYVTSVAFSPDGQYIVSGSGDKTVRLWNLKGEPIGSPFVGHQDDVTSVAFSPDGEYIVSGSGDKTVRLWRVGWKAWLPLACDKLRDHPILKNPDTDEAKGAKETCEKYVWSKQDKR